MQQIELHIRWLKAEECLDLSLPTYHSKLAAGADIAAAVKKRYLLQPGEIYLFPTGFCVAIPDGYELQIRTRSGLAVKHGITLINSPGTIDADYRGEIKIPLINHGKEPFAVSRGDRIAQMILAPVVQAKFQVVEKLDETVRGEGGFGHTGVKA